MTVAELVAAWRDRAAELRDWGADGPARAVEQCAGELERALAATELEPLTLDEAATESGYTQAHLRRLLRDGTVPNAGTDDDLRIPGRNLPRKPGYRVAQPHPEGASSRSQVARAVARGG